MTCPGISIAMATCNGERFVQKQLESLARQTRLPDELIVCDDASTDRTVAIVESFGRTVPFDVRIRRNPERLGYAQNFALALSLCTGALVFLSDQDDVWLPNKLQHVADKFARSADILVVTNNSFVTGKSIEKTKVTKLKNIRSAGLPNTALISGCNTAARREWIQFILPVPASNISHDIWLNKLADMLSVRRIDMTPLQYYRRHDDNASQWVVNRIHTMDLRERFSIRLQARAGPPWEDEFHYVNEYACRLASRTDDLERLGLRARRDQIMPRLLAKAAMLRPRAPEV
jgi:glycosyltransferase involved in cell wall biosynthesis